MGLGRPSSAGGHAVWSLTAWTPARGEVQSSGQSCGPEAGLHAQAAPPGTCHQRKVPRHDHNGTASERVTSYHCGPHVTPGNSRLRRVETASGLHPSPSGPGALPWRIQGFGSLAGAATGGLCFAVGGAGTEQGGREGAGSLEGRGGREPGGQRWAGRPQSSLQTGQSYWETSQDPAGAHGGRAEAAGLLGGRRCQAAAGSELWACAMCRGRKPTAAGRINTEQDTAEEGGPNQTNA